MKLILPTIQYKESFLLAVSAHKKTEEHDGLFDEHSEAWFVDNFEKLLEKHDHYRQGIHLEDGHVPSSEFWVVEDGTWLGRYSLRHSLNDYLTQYGGNLGYYLIPKARRKGIGTAAMKYVLNEARKLKMDKLLLTCDADNIGSQKLIQKFGGILENSIPDKDTGKPLMRWWIDLSEV